MSEFKRATLELNPDLNKSYNSDQLEILEQVKEDWVSRVFSTNLEVSHKNFQSSISWFLNKCNGLNVEIKFHYFVNPFEMEKEYFNRFSTKYEKASKSLYRVVKDKNKLQEEVSFMVYNYTEAITILIKEFKILIREDSVYEGFKEIVDLCKSGVFYFVLKGNEVFYCKGATKIFVDEHQTIIWKLIMLNKNYLTLFLMTL